MLTDTQSFSYNTRCKHASVELLTRNVLRGFRPKWYVVFHFNDGASSQRQRKRRLDPDEVEKDLLVIKDKLYTKLYGRNWAKVKRRCRSVWGVEYGVSQVKPHINLLIEDMPYPFADYNSALFLFNLYLPSKCKCLYKNSSHLQPVDSERVWGVNTYICKESTETNLSINLEVSDLIK